jgi:cellulose biosynthesis protein BcsQ
VDELAQGKILTFYSYKGGTGRSMALANYACWLVRRLEVPRQRVLMMDWDLEAPGLHRYFVQKTGLPENSSRPGVINYFDELYKKLEGDPALYEKLVSDSSGKILLEEFPLDDYLIRDVVSGADLIKAGKLDADYAQLVSAFNWITFHGKYGSLLNVIRNLLERTYSYCLIDSRTGFNDISGICTMVMPEKLVTVFTPNYQNLYGVLDLAERAVTYRRASGDFRPLAVFPLPSRIENAELDLKSWWRKEYQKEFESRLRSIYQLETCSLDKYFDKAQLPHVSFYAYGEEIALLKEERSDNLSLSGAYEEFFQRLTELDTAWDSFAEAGIKEELLPIAPPIIKSSKRTELEIYISYAHIDNRPLMEEQNGWISTFHQALEVRLSQLLGEEVEIWRDSKLQGGDFFNAVITNRIEQANVFIPIVTPRYLKSESCIRELEQFLTRSDHQGQDLTIGNLSRIFKVVKTPIPTESQPPGLQSLLGYQFYEFDKGDRVREFSNNLGSGQDVKFWARIDDLASDIVRLIRASQSISQKPAPDVVFDTPAIYLAETTSDLVLDRDNIKRELQGYGYKVLPDRELPIQDGAAFKAAVTDQLARSSLSVHLIGNKYGLIPENESRSIAMIQEELAAERASSDSAFTRLIWIPVELADDERQRSYIEGLQNDLIAGAEILQTPLEELKTRILEKLKQAPPPLARDVGRDLISVYLVYDKLDADAIGPIYEFLFAQGYEIIASLGEGENAQSAQYHRENLLNCDAVLIFYGKGSALWLRSRLWDLRKVKGWGRAKPMLAVAVYLAQPSSPEKLLFRTHEATVIDGLDQHVATALQPFVAQISKPPQ